jgi:hypothetical protein
LAFIIVVFSIRGQFGIANYNLYQGNPPIRTIQKIANLVNQHHPGQPIFVLEGLYVAVETNRDVFPGLSMAQYSILDLSTEAASEVHLVNTEMVASMIGSANIKILILTEMEYDFLSESITGFESLLEENYRQILEIDHFGQKAVKAYLFIRE